MTVMSLRSFCLGTCWLVPTKMAQRLIIRRILASSGKSLVVRAQTSFSLISKCKRTFGLLSTCSQTSRLDILNTARKISMSPSCRVTFNVQNKDDFQDRVVGSETPVVVDFHAQWCGPCKLLAPRLEKVVAKHEGKVLMAKVDIDDHTDLALKYEVSAVPTVLAMKNGDVVDHFVGVKDVDELEAFLKKLIGP
ncbi:thioredoxin, mitochondrial [Mixophyes fleayi]|uniref:thioredoxin, mitochondrial n=1 Tax=Mixophyes fleayi TaxID=3061075 RepID=UPI003F4DB7D3